MRAVWLFECFDDETGRTILAWDLRPCPEVDKDEVDDGGLQKVLAVKTADERSSMYGINCPQSRSIARGGRKEEIHWMRWLHFDVDFGESIGWSLDDVEAKRGSGGQDDGRLRGGMGMWEEEDGVEGHSKGKDGQIRGMRREGEKPAPF
ncbi:hypothetical protein TNIN_385451 [Trichonephila inaurata madagascariensis]|uniref:Uncharacterized protein n=1 Tax=Trichonephila inaurata madagascariensis TaxID=2747483 RepID=A0A8X6XZL8_9ARAC|nr:hypothetical protein TNIN_385451 [Trichonephila inaurata madagascariensis]